MFHSSRIHRTGLVPNMVAAGRIRGVAKLRVALCFGLLYATAHCGGTDVSAPNRSQVARITLSASRAPRVTAGDTMQIAAVIVDANGKAVSDAGLSFTSSQTSIATISASGLLTSVGPVGTTVVTASAEGVTSNALAIAIVAGPPQAVTATRGQSQIGKTAGMGADTLGARVTDSFGNPVAGTTVNWKASDASTLARTSTTTDSSGDTWNLITLSNTPGSVTVTASLAGNVSASFSITSTPPPVPSIAEPVQFSATVSAQAQARVKEFLSAAGSAPNGSSARILVPSGGSGALLMANDSSGAPLFLTISGPDAVHFDSDHTALALVHLVMGALDPSQVSPSQFETTARAATTFATLAAKIGADVEAGQSPVNASDVLQLVVQVASETRQSLDGGAPSVTARRVPAKPSSLKTRRMPTRSSAKRLRMPGPERTNDLIPSFYGPNASWFIDVRPLFGSLWLDDTPTPGPGVNVMNETRLDWEASTIVDGSATVIDREAVPYVPFDFWGGFVPYYRQPSITSLLGNGTRFTVSVAQTPATRTKAATMIITGTYDLALDVSGLKKGTKDEGTCVAAFVTAATNNSEFAQLVSSGTREDLLAWLRHMLPADDLKASYDLYGDLLEGCGVDLPSDLNWQQVLGKFGIELSGIALKLLAVYSDVKAATPYGSLGELSYETYQYWDKNYHATICKEAGVIAECVQSIAIAPPSAAIKVGDQVLLAATVTGVSGKVLTDRTITWHTSNAGVATVDGSGLVTAEDTGVTTITAASGGATGTATVSVGPPAVARVDIAGPTTVKAGATVQLTATLYDGAGRVLTGREIVWSTDNSGVAAVSQAGVVTGIAIGTATLTATSEGKSAKLTITVVEEPVASVTVVVPTTNKIPLGQTLLLMATLKDSSGRELTDRTINWTSSNESVATVSPDGVVTGLESGGPVTITASSEGKSGSTTVTVLSIWPLATGNRWQWHIDMEDQGGGPQSWDYVEAVIAADRQPFAETGTIQVYQLLSGGSWTTESQFSRANLARGPQGPGHYAPAPQTGSTLTFRYPGTPGDSYDWSGTTTVLVSTNQPISGAFGNGVAYYYESTFPGESIPATKQWLVPGIGLVRREEWCRPDGAPRRLCDTWTLTSFTIN